MREIYNKTLYDEEIYRDYSMINYMERTRVYKIIVNIILSIWTLSIISRILITNIMLIIFLLVIMIICFIIINTKFFINMSINRVIKNDKYFLNILQEYIFDDNSIQIKNNNGNTKLNYNQIMSVLETNKYIFLYVGANQAFLLNKIGTEDDRVEEMINLLKSKVSKYKISNK